MKDAYPLHWPMQWPRTSEDEREWGALNKMSAGKIRLDLNHELKLLNADNVVISSNVAIRRDGLPYSNQKRPDDPGVVLYFMRNGSEVCIPCDRWMTVDANLRAIGKTIEAIRGIERWGAGDLVDAAFNGITNKALPANAIVTPYQKRAWYEVLGVSQDAPKEVIVGAYRALLKVRHPDKGGTNEAFMELQAAWKEVSNRA